MIGKKEDKGELIPEEAADKGSPWEMTYGVRIEMWLPMDQLDLMLDGIDSLTYR